MPRSGSAWLVPFVVVACSHSHKAEDHAGKPVLSAAPAAAPAVVPSAVGSSTPKRRELACDKTTAIDASGQLMGDWNAALNAHDVERLEKVYTSRVSFYGRDLTRAQVLAGKRQALAAAPAYKQQLSDVRFAPEGDSSASVTFDKASVGAKTTRGRLLVQCGDDQRYGISTESDAPSDALGGGQEDCESAMYSVAFTLPQVKHAMTYATDEAPFGGLSYPTEGKHVSAAIGYHHPDRFEATFFLDWDKGAFTINQGDVPVPAAGRARVKAACSN